MAVRVASEPGADRGEQEGAQLCACASVQQMGGDGKKKKKIIINTRGRRNHLHVVGGVRVCGVNSE